MSGLGEEKKIQGLGFYEGVVADLGEQPRVDVDLDERRAFYRSYIEENWPRLEPTRWPSVGDLERARGWAPWRPEGASRRPDKPREGVADRPGLGADSSPTEEEAVAPRRGQSAIGGVDVIAVKEGGHVHTSPVRELQVHPGPETEGS